MMKRPSIRDLIERAYGAGGSTAAYTAAMALDLVAVSREDERPTDTSGLGIGKSVTILGAGIAGLVLARELRRAGFSVRILESRGKVGGRVLTLRGGDVVEEVDSRQEVNWDQEDHLYFNAGAARIPQHHSAVVDLCRETNTPLEVVINDNRGAFFQDSSVFGGASKRSRSVINDIRGFVSELAYKSVDASLFDRELTNDDLARVRDLLREFGALSPDGRYRGSSRIGFTEPLGAGHQDEYSFNSPLDFADIVRSDFWRWKSYFGELLDSAATILQPVGGMDALVRKLGEEVRPLTRLRSQVTAISKAADHVHLQWLDLDEGETHEDTSDFVVCTLPFPILSKIESDIDPELKRLMTRVEYIDGGKVAFQSRRFWERDLGVYGGISWTADKNTQLWYPSHGIHKEKGIVLGAFTQYGPSSDWFAALTIEERIAMAQQGCERIHPGFQEEVDCGVAISWKKVPHSLCGWAHWEPDTRAEVYPAFLKPDDRIYFAGEHVSNMTGWQEGAIRSAYFTLTQLYRRVCA
jgi:monoamine oxidase